MKLALGIILAVVLYRTLALSGMDRFEWLPNFAPITALALCGAMFLPLRLAFFLPLGALFFSDLLINASLGTPLFAADMLGRYLSLIAVVGIGLYLRSRPTFTMAMTGALTSALLFYFVTNTISWAANPLYAPNFAGWLQAVLYGLPGYPPTWMFFRNALMADLIFTALFVGCMAWSRRTAASAPPPAVMRQAC